MTGTRGPQDPVRMTVLEEMKVAQRKKRFIVLGIVIAIVVVALLAAQLAKMMGKDDDQSRSEKAYYSDEDTQQSGTDDGPSTTGAAPAVEVATSGVSNKTTGSANEISVGAIVYNPSDLTAVNVRATFDVKAEGGRVVATGTASHRSIAPKAHAAMSTAIKVPDGVPLTGIIVDAKAANAQEAIPQKFEFSNLVYTSTSPAVFTGEIKNASNRIAKKIQIQCAVLDAAKPLGGAFGAIEELAPGASMRFELRDGLINGIRPTNSACYATGE